MCDKCKERDNAMRDLIVNDRDAALKEITRYAGGMIGLAVLAALFDLRDRFGDPIVAGEAVMAAMGEFKEMLSKDHADIVTDRQRTVDQLIKS